GRRGRPQPKGCAQPTTRQVGVYRSLRGTHGSLLVPRRVRTIETPMPRARNTLVCLVLAGAAVHLACAVSSSGCGGSVAEPPGTSATDSPEASADGSGASRAVRGGSADAGSGSSSSSGGPAGSGSGGSAGAKKCSALGGVCSGWGDPCGDGFFGTFEGCGYC